MKKLFFVLTVMLISSCASIPKESVDLMQVVINQNKKAFDLNASLINKLYTDKKQDVDTFIDGDYTREFWKNYRSQIPPGVNIEENITSIIPAVSKEINAQRSEMKKVLETARLETLNLLEQDYVIQKEASTEIKNLLVSATKINEERRAILGRYSSQLNLGFDIDQIENSIDSFILNSGDVGADITRLGQDLLTNLNRLKK